MQLKEFFSILSPEFLQQQRIINFIFAEPQPLFSSCILARIKALLKRSVTICDVDEMSHAELVSRLFMSFLGNASLYVFGSASQLFQPNTELRTLLANYEGEHLVLCSTKLEHALKGDGILVVSATEPLDASSYKQLCAILGYSSVDERFVQELFQRTAALSLDRACLVMQYQQLVGKSAREFFAQWLDRLVVPSKSLFNLSQQLFARNGKQFYATWAQHAADYPLEFWIAFWSEQLWQAVLFVTTAQQEGVVAAKKVVNRLPFSFMQKDWQRYTPVKLAQAHDLLYQIDYANKNGVLHEGLDLFFMRFLR